MKWVSIFRYALSSLCIIELDKATFNCDKAQPGRYHNRTDHMYIFMGRWIY